MPLQQRRRWLIGFAPEGDAGMGLGALGDFAIKGFVVRLGHELKGGDGSVAVKPYALIENFHGIRHSSDHPGSDPGASVAFLHNNKYCCTILRDTTSGHLP